MVNYSVFRKFKVFLISFGIIFLATNVSAEKRYIVDVLVVSLRDGPANSFRSVKTLRTGHSFQVIGEQNDYIKVQLEDDTTGWLPQKYTSTKPPKSILAEQLSQKIDVIEKEKGRLKETTASLKDQLKTKDKTIAEYKTKYDLIKKTENADLVNLQRQLDDITAKHQSLVENSKSTIHTIKERDNLKKENASLKNTVKRLDADNTSLANKQALYWFLAGGGVFILGWLIGRVSCKRQKSSLTL